MPIGAIPHAGINAPVPTQPGQSLTLDLYRSLPTYAKVGTITFTATSAIGGTWSTQGVSLSGTWSN